MLNSTKKCDTRKRTEIVKILPDKNVPYITNGKKKRLTESIILF